MLYSSTDSSVSLPAFGFDKATVSTSGNWAPCLPPNIAFNKNIMHPIYLVECETNSAMFDLSIQVKLKYSDILKIID